MEEQIHELASRIREMRELRNITQGQVADALGIPLKTYRSYEDGEADIPASMLYGIAHTLGVDMATLLTGEEPRMRIFSVTRAHKGATVERRRQYGYEALADNFIRKRGEFFIVTVPPSDTLPERNAHEGHEFNFVLEGSVRVSIHHNEITLHEGDSLYFDASYEHAMTALGGTSARFLAVIL